jgi:hypothetical protein
MLCLGRKMNERISVLHIYITLLRRQNRHAYAVTFDSLTTFLTTLADHPLVEGGALSFLNYRGNYSKPAFGTCRTF